MDSGTWNRLPMRSAPSLDNSSTDAKPDLLLDLIGKLVKTENNVLLTGKSDDCKPKLHQKTGSTGRGSVRPETDHMIVGE